MSASTKDIPQSVIGRLADAVAIPSISCDDEHHDDCVRMADFVETALSDCAVETRRVSPGTRTVDGQVVDLPPVILGRINCEPESKFTLLIYGHYDVVPAGNIADWTSDPFALTTEWGEPMDLSLVGRGTADNKGALMAWIGILEAHKEQGRALPVNLRFCFEGMHEADSPGLPGILAEERATGWFADVDGICITEGQWLSGTPCVIYGQRGLVYYDLTVSGPASDLHSGVFGRTIFEPMTALIALMGKLVAQDGTILIPGIDSQVPAPDDEENDLYASLRFSHRAFAESVGWRDGALSNKMAEVLMGRMRYAALSLHGIENAVSSPGAHTVIPASVTGKFSIRLVPPLTPDIVDPLVRKHLNEEFAKLKTKTTLKIDRLIANEAWATDNASACVRAAIAATESVYGIHPDLIREGGNVPITVTISNAIPGVPMVVLPMGRGDSNAHGPNECLHLTNFMQGAGVFSALLYEL